MAEQTVTRRAAPRSAPVQANARTMTGPGQGRLAEVEQSLITSPAARRVRQFAANVAAQAPNRTGLPDTLKQGVESLSGLSMDQVRVHYNSSRPAQLGAHAYAQGADIHLGPGQEQHLPHEAWHVVQQAQGRVRPTLQLKAGVPVNDEASLEQEATVMGQRALPGPVQRAVETDARDAGMGDAAPAGHARPIQRLSFHNKTVRASTLAEPVLLTLSHAIAKHGPIGISNPLRVGNYTVEKADVEYIERALENFQNPQIRKKINQDNKAILKAPYDEKTDEDYKPGLNDELVFYLTTVAREQHGLNTIKLDKTGQQRELKNWSETGLQGAMGEQLAREALKREGHKVTDLNALSLNFPGIDNLTSHTTYPFEQTKLHLSTSTATPEIYLNHLERADTYAVKAIQGLLRRKDKFDQLLGHPKFRDHKLLNELRAELDNLEGRAEDDILGTRAHELVRDGMRFTVPSDIYSKIPKRKRAHFVALSKTVAELREVMRQDLVEDFDERRPRDRDQLDADYDPFMRRRKR